MRADAGSPAPAARRRLHPGLLVHAAPIGGSRRLIAQADAGRQPLALNHPAALTALSALPSEFDRREAAGAWADAGVPADAHAQLWEAFESAGLLVDAEHDAGEWWGELGWAEARTYHLSTRDYPFLQMDEPGAFARDGERMEGYRAVAPSPSPYQRVGDSTIELPGLGEGQSADEHLARLDADDRLGLPGLGLLLDVCFGERGRLLAAGGATCLLKSIPSGGARHPTEIFVAAFDLPGLPAGIYHYEVEHHRLGLVAEGDRGAEFAGATFDLFDKHPRRPAAALVFTSLVERAMWRYRDPRSFRAILADVGHAVAAYRTVARMIGFRTYALQKMRDREVAALLGVDPLVQPPLYAGTLVK